MFNFSNALVTLNNGNVVEVLSKIIKTPDGFTLTVKAENIPKNAEFIDTIQFTTTDLFGIYRKDLSAHLESCFIFVAEYCGFKVEKCCDDTIFNLKSVLS